MRGREAYRRRTVAETARFIKRGVTNPGTLLPNRDRRYRCSAGTRNRTQEGSTKPIVRPGRVSPRSCLQRQPDAESEGSLRGDRCHRPERRGPGSFPGPCRREGRSPGTLRPQDRRTGGGAVPRTQPPTAQELPARRADRPRLRTRRPGRGLRPGLLRGARRRGGQARGPVAALARPAPGHRSADQGHGRRRGGTAVLDELPPLELESEAEPDTAVDIPVPRAHDEALPAETSSRPTRIRPSMRSSPSPAGSSGTRCTRPTR